MVSASASAYVRIVVGGTKLVWTESVLSWKLQQDGSDDVNDRSHGPALKHAFASWENAPGSGINFRYDGETGSRSTSGSDHLILFDEDGSSGYFPLGSGLVAITPITYSVSSGRILDADILFNGRDYRFATDGTPGRFDIQDVATHEIGHFLGLDHSPVVGSSLWPYVSSTQWLHRSLSSDDIAGAVAVRTSGGDGRLKGTVQKSDGSALVGALVAAVERGAGRLAGTALSTSSGAWTIRGLAAGSYSVHISPVEGGMTEANITGDGTLETNFGAAFYGGLLTPVTFSLSPGASLDCGTRQLLPDHTLMERSSTTTILRPGDSKTLTIVGTNFSPGGMRAGTLSPHLQVSALASGSTWMSVQVQVSATAPLGSYDLYLVRSDGAFDPIPGLLDVVAPAPTLTGIQNTTGSTGGGEIVTLTGTGLQNGAYVLFGGVESSSVTWLDANTLQALTPVASPATVDLSVHNPDGQQARLSDAFTFISVPVFRGLFPSAGQSQGGTTLLIRGSQFSSQIQVLLGGVSQTVQAISPSLLQVTTSSGAAGTADLVLRNPMAADLVLPDAFTWVAVSDPQISSFTPSRSGGSGGVKVKLFGTNLAGAKKVRFGADVMTGAGGVFGKGLSALDASTLKVIAPAWRAGSYGIIVEMPNGQGVMASATFLYDPPQTAAGCGGIVGRPGAWAGSADLVGLLFLATAWRLIRRPRVLLQRA